MFSKAGLWILIKVAEGIAKKYLTLSKGEERRTKVVDYLITRASKAKVSKTSADDDILRYWSGFLKSERLKQALKTK